MKKEECNVYGTGSTAVKYLLRDCCVLYVDYSGFNFIQNRYYVVACCVVSNRLASYTNGFSKTDMVGYSLLWCM